ncbi:MAG: nuclear transport factor 2 family protein, partial [Solirubrobacterales bacterium]
HYFNERLPDLEGDYAGVDGLRTFFGRLQELSGGSFRVEPISLTPFGDELVAAHVTNILSVSGTDLELDALVLWRVNDGQVHEAWDIPAVRTSRTRAAPQVQGAPET